MFYDVLIIGAGAAGLMAAKELADARCKVCLLEATGIAGGRISTITEKEFVCPVETGAEFIHGKLPVTIDLLKQAGIAYQPVGGKMIPVQNGVWLGEDSYNEDFNVLTEKLKRLEKDCTIREFLDANFSPSEYDSLRKEVQQFSEGFGLADINKASAFSLREEREQLNDEQYRISGGYQQLVQYLFEECSRAGTIIHFFSPVYKIEHRKGSVIAHTVNNKQYQASKIIITASIGVLQSGDIEFIPRLTPHEQAIRQIGFGSVIKFLFQFKKSFWPDDAGFLLSDEFVPTWWTQLPMVVPLLTGWLGGPKAVAASALPETKLCEMALSSLAGIFQIKSGSLEKQLQYYKIICWDKLPYIKGGYSYNTVESDNARAMLLKPVDDTIYFAGEAIYEGESQGTVEAALQSGRGVVSLIKKSLLSD